MHMSHRLIAVLAAAAGLAVASGLAVDYGASMIPNRVSGILRSWLAASGELVRN